MQNRFIVLNFNNFQSVVFIVDNAVLDGLVAYLEHGCRMTRDIHMQIDKYIGYREIQSLVSLDWMPTYCRVAYVNSDTLATVIERIELSGLV